MKNRSKVVKLFVIYGIFVIIGAVAFFYSLNNYIYNQKQPTPQEKKESTDPYRGTLSGEYICLPHTDTSGPQTLECALGLKTDSNEYYSVDFSLMSQMHEALPTGTKFKANGLITPIENISSDHWKKYPIEGIFSVTDSVEILK